jgi:hypothetical protein
MTTSCGASLGGGQLLGLHAQLDLAGHGQSVRYAASGAPDDINTTVSRLELLTDEIGCSARRSIATAGQFVYFLSDAGVYRLDTRLDLKLRGDTKPLSEPIADQVARIQPAGAEYAVGLWHDNRYWLAAPVDGADVNNALFVYSALNEQWESIDEYPFGVDNLIVAQRGGLNRRVLWPRAGRASSSSWKTSSGATIRRIARWALISSRWSQAGSRRGAMAWTP